jgi:hypothetical protein
VTYTSNPYRLDEWEWRVQDLFGRLFADLLGLEHQDMTALSAIMAHKPMFYLPVRSIQKLITVNRSVVFRPCWDDCSEFLDVADLLANASTVTEEQQGS